ncbi:hypothetical protein CF15_05805 [Pyrodictium occultum]|uniref:Uncharacterized protein n=1 Tax=Pyrodictium occultum TaxID=2309 RepID=A0A0V8RW71_PYROC|nr:hypothetical protein [Pyrodictium occultum]KSW12264.1 hypothetical protein CF15_05805 [Pyrodictium occultum]
MPGYCVHRVDLRLVSPDASLLFECLLRAGEKLCKESNCAPGSKAGWLVASRKTCLVTMKPPKPVSAGLHAIPASYEAGVVVECSEPSDVVESVMLLESLASECRGVGLMLT